jgi:nucleolar protein 58
MARMVVTKTALSVRVDALTDAGEKSTLSAPTIGLENCAKPEAHLRSLKVEDNTVGM